MTSYRLTKTEATKLKKLLDDNGDKPNTKLKYLFTQLCDNKLSLDEKKDLIKNYK